MLPSLLLLLALCGGRKIEPCLAEKEKKMTENNMTYILVENEEVGGGEGFCIRIFFIVLDECVLSKVRLHLVSSSFFALSFSLLVDFL